MSNFRPISLLNVDIKLYPKMLENRLLPLLPSLVFHDQMGFAPGREARDNTIKALHVHHWMSSRVQPGFFLLLDDEKAFDRVAWDYMTAVLQTIGLPARLMAFIHVLYPSARVRVNGTLSVEFHITNGSRQGCPLSPLIYILTLEPLLRPLRSNFDIKGIQIRNKEYKMTAFADDVLLFLTEPLTSLPVLLQDFDLFQALSNLKINLTKYFAQNISLPQTVLETC